MAPNDDVFGGGSGDDMDKAIGGMIRQLVQHKVDARDIDSDITQLLEGRAMDIARSVLPHIVEVRKPDFPDFSGKPQMTHKKFELILHALQCENVALIGPSGSGKTFLAEQLAEALGLKFYFNGAIASEYKLSGFVDANGNYISTQFREAYENGGLYLFDEVDASLPQALLAFNAALAGGHADFPTGRVERHPDFKCIAAANTYGRGADRLYVGRNQLDAATLDRFLVVDLDYDEDLENMLTPNKGWAKYVQACRKAVQEIGIRHVVSYRASMAGSKLLSLGVGRDEVEQIALWKGLDADSVEKVRKQALRSTMPRHYDDDDYRHG